MRVRCGTAGTALALVVTLAACGRSERGAAHAPPCPELALDLPARSEAITARLASVPEGAALIEATRSRVGRICFAQGAINGIDDDATIVIERALDEGEAAARVGHLLSHLRDGAPYPEHVERGADCDAIVRRAIDAEARAHALELELRRALGVEHGQLAFAFEQAFWNAPESERVSLVRSWLIEHPDGGSGVDALAAGYRQRCERDAR